MLKVESPHLRKIKLYSLLTFIVIIIIFTIVNVVSFTRHLYPNTSEKIGSWMEFPLDVDKLENGDLLITSSPFSNRVGTGIFPKSNFNDSLMNSVYQLNSFGEKVWSYEGLGFPHEIEEINYNNSKYYFIADTLGDRVKLIDSEQVLHWEFKVNLINWSLIDPEFASIDYYFEEDQEDWTHVNDVDFIEGVKYNQTYDSLLISIKNFNLIVMANFTAEFNEMPLGDKYGSAENIYWWFGPGILSNQHNSDLLPSGNIVVCDFLHNRIIEVNRTTKEVTYELSSVSESQLYQPKDADYNPQDDTYLITDSGNNRILIVNRNTRTILWQWSEKISFPYESDFLSNGNILISGAVSGIILEVNPSTNQIIKMIDLNEGKNSLYTSFLLLNIFFFLLFSYFVGVNIYQIIYSKKLNGFIPVKNWLFLGLFLLLLISFLLITIFSKELYFEGIFLISRMRQIIKNQ